MIKSTESFLNGAVAGSRKWGGILACIAWISACTGAIPPTIGNWSSATSLPYKGPPPKLKLLSWDPCPWP